MQARFRRVLTLLGLLAVCVGMVGCSRTAVYEAQTACSIEAGEVATMLDTDRFAADDAVFPDLPQERSTTGVESSLVCFAEGGDRRLRVRVDFVGPTEVERLQSLMSEGSPFEVGDGRATAGRTSATWACGTIRATLQLSKDGDSPYDLAIDEQTMRAAITDLADAVGCYQYPE